jgi:hypothetical protein
MLDDPFILSAVSAALLPLLTSGILTGIFGRLFGVRAAGCAIALAFVIALVSILGWPPLLPRSSGQKLAYLVLLGLLLGILLDFAVARAPLRAVAPVWSAVIVAWLGWQQLLGLQPSDLARLALLWLAGAFVFDRLLAFRATGIVAPTMVLVAGIGMSGITFLGHAASLSQLAAAVAAGTGGFLLLNWPRQRYPFSTATLFGAGTALFAVAAASVLFTQANVLALAILLAIFAAGSVRAWLSVDRPIWGPIAFGIIALIPVLLAIVIVILMAPSADYCAYFQC